MTDPLITGSFFDLVHPNLWDAAYWHDSCRFWKEENWRALISDMHEIGIDTAICLNTAFWGRPLFPGYEKTVGIPFRMGCEDPLGECTKQADKLGMKMFLGIGLRGRVSQVRDYANMAPPWPDCWFIWNRELACALAERYGNHPSFAGFYIPYEIDFADHQIELYTKFIGEHLRPAIGDLPLLTSPGTLGIHPDIEKLPGQLERMGFNILAPQDWGGRSNNVEEALDFARGNARGLEIIGKRIAEAGVTLWCNCEMFEFSDSPDGRNYCVPGPFSRIKRQIELATPVAEKLICYQYQGIMNCKTQLVNIGSDGTQDLYDRYVDYRATQCGSGGAALIRRKRK